MSNQPVNEKEYKIRTDAITRDHINVLCKHRNMTQSEVVALAVQHLIADTFIADTVERIGAATQALRDVADTIDVERVLSPEVQAGRYLVRKGSKVLFVDQRGRVYTENVNTGEKASHFTIDG